eukprot:TRINITY_DN17582_c0_g1_i1.p1 TRINITY_DN17582_c0_g1~~TRINITY_DN17582_c0_g1_i1.p1  ORF type:complete len:431 (+),score=118.07 TRINITY_DN17582_c0_g1_i1:70-1362(+)
MRRAIFFTSALAAFSFAIASLEPAVTMAAGALPRVAVLGGGIAGCTAAGRLARLGAHVTLVEMGRDVGGRASTRRTREDERIAVDHGAPAAEMLTPKGLAMTQDLVDRGWVESFSGAIGRLAPGASAITPGTSASTTAGGEEVRRFRGSPTMNRWCEGLLEGTTVAKSYGRMVRGLVPVRGEADTVAGWRLLDKEDAVVAECDWLFVCGSGVAHPRWTQTFGGAPPLVQAAKDVRDARLDAALEAIGAVGVRPVQAALLGFSGDAAAAWSALPFAIAEIEGDEEVAKVVVQRRGDFVFVVVHSTAAFAGSSQDAFGSSSTAARLGGAGATCDADRERAVVDALVRGLERAVSGFEPKPSAAGACFGPLLHRWGNAFPSGSALATPADGFLPQSRLAFAGDFVGERAGSVEGAMLSGAAAAELLAEHVGRG